MLFSVMKQTVQGPVFVQNKVIIFENRTTRMGVSRVIKSILDIAIFCKVGDRPQQQGLTKALRDPTFQSQLLKIFLFLSLISVLFPNQEVSRKGIQNVERLWSAACELKLQSWKNCILNIFYLYELYIVRHSVSQLVSKEQLITDV